AVLNDGRYGHGLLGEGVRVSLLRAAKYPDPTADHGRHRVTISVLPHGSGLHEVIHEAAALNLPLRLFTDGEDAGEAEFEKVPVAIDHPGVEVSAVKRADDDSGDLVVRLAEMCGDRSAVTVRTPRPVLAASRCNLLEELETSLDVADGLVTLAMRPFELITLRLTT
ncbi:MAG: alpha-mannosidase, partial [Ilumatobacteraceae bacterium]|nr:alpha-mannosidase [Ilumatobacteraceae bacterium]